MTRYREPASRKTVTANDSTSSKIATPPTTELTAYEIELCCDTADVHFRFGATGESALSTDPVLKAGVIYREPHRGKTHLHVLAVSGFGSGHVVEATPVAPYPVRIG